MIKLGDLTNLETTNCTITGTNYYVGVSCYDNNLPIPGLTFFLY
jgi:hypothetical protein